MSKQENSFNGDRPNEKISFSEFLANQRRTLEDLQADHARAAQPRQILRGQDAYAYLESVYRQAVADGSAWAPSEKTDPSEAQAGAEPPERSGGGGVGEPQRSDPHLLEGDHKHCGAVPPATTDPRPTPVTSETLYEARKCRCSSWFCDGCCESKGIAVQRRLRPVLETFKGVMMWTFTLDPELFETPEEAFRFVRHKRCISELMRTLRERGYLHSDRYFYVVEFQKESQQAHWHLLMDATYIPKEVVQEIWDRFRPKSAGPKPANRPGLGMVRYSAPRFKSRVHAANYATKYLTKPPRDGYPDWVLDYEGYVRRYDVSRGFWASVEADTDGDGGTDAPAPWDEPTAGEADPEGCDGNVKEPRKAPGEVSTIRDRLEKCGRKTFIIGRENVEYSNGHRETLTRFIVILKWMSFNDVKEFLGFAGFEISALPLDVDMIRRLRMEDARRRFEFRLSCIRGIDVEREIDDLKEEEWWGEEAEAVFAAFTS